MKSLVDWLKRTVLVTPEELERITLRLFVPGDAMLNLDDWIMTTEQPHQVPPGFLAGYPETMAILAFTDVKDSSKHVERHHQLSVDLAAAMSLALSRRVDIPYEISASVEGSNSVTFLPYGGHVDRTLSGPLPDDSKVRIAAVLHQIAGLPEKDLKPIGAAVRCPPH